MKINKKELRRELALKADECSKPDWGSYGEKPILKKDYLEAIEIIDWLPDSITHPDILISKWGEILFEFDFAFKGAVIEKKKHWIIQLDGDREDIITINLKEALSKDIVKYLTK